MLQLIVDYLVDNGVDENEVDHLIREKIFNGKSILDLSKDGNAWAAAVSWITGEDFDYLQTLDSKTLNHKYMVIW